MTGITGHFGYLVLQDLLKKGIQNQDLVGLARNPEKAHKKLSEDIEIHQADFNNLASLQLALKGIDRVLLISTKEPDPIKRAAQHTNVIKAAKANDISLLVYTGGTKPDQNPLGKAHQLTEDFLKTSGVP